MTRISFAVLAVSFVAMGAIACGRTGDKAFRARAAQDLACPEAELYIQHKWEGGEATKLASGCGREAMYVRECQHEGCLWKMQAPGTAPGTTATAAPATTDTAAPTTTATAAPTTTATAAPTTTATAAPTTTATAAPTTTTTAAPKAP